jgi:FKBP-type peptidyl-prolyl cis-trans isomerase SlpA
MNKEKTIQPGSKVCFHYSITLEDGTIADSSFDEEPIEIQLGDGQLHECLEMALIGLKEDEEQTLEIDPDQGFGYHDPEAVNKMAQSEFPEGMNPEPGQIISLVAPTGEEMPASIIAVDDESITLDLNHPLAGHTLTFRTRIISIDP